MADTQAWALTAFLLRQNGILPPTATLSSQTAATLPVHLPARQTSGEIAWGWGLAGIIGLGVYSSAYYSEIFRGGFAAVPRGQVEAATSVGMTPFDILFRVRLPIALVAAAPPIVNTLIVMSKETVVLSIITVPELMYQMQTMAAETFTAFDAIFAMAVFYWALVEIVSRLGRRVEARATAFLASRP